MLLDPLSPVGVPVDHARVPPRLALHHVYCALQRVPPALHDAVRELRARHAPAEARRGVAVRHVGNQLQRELARVLDALQHALPGARALHGGLDHDARRQDLVEQPGEHAGADLAGRGRGSLDFDACREEVAMYKIKARCGGTGRTRLEQLSNRDLHWDALRLNEKTRRKQETAVLMLRILLCRTKQRHRFREPVVGC